MLNQAETEFMNELDQWHETYGQDLFDVIERWLEEKKTPSSGSHALRTSDE